MENVIIRIGGEAFVAAVQNQAAPRTCALFRGMLPFRRRLVHARWSGEACWTPLGQLGRTLDFENATSRPRPGDVLFYAGEKSEAELLLAYGPTRFACEAGALAGNPLFRIEERLARLAEIGAAVLWQGAHDIVIERLA